MRFHSSTLAGAVFSFVGLLTACANDRSAGGSAETENSVVARIFLIDSLQPDWNRPEHQPTVITLRLDSQDLDFTLGDASGRDVDIRREDSSSLTFEIKQWDAALKSARLLVRLDTGLSAPGYRLYLWRGLPRQDRSNPTKVWQNLPDSQMVALTSVLVDDFEDGTTKTLLPDSSTWFIGGASGTGITTIGSPRGKALRLVSTATSSTAESLAAALLAATPRSLRTIDSIVLWARVMGDAKISLEYAGAGTQRVAWASLPRDSSWKRISIKPSAFDTGSSVRTNWSQVRDNVTHLSFWMAGSGELWIDEPRIFGIDRDDLK